MSAEIIPFDFEEQAVRVVMRGEDPWFVVNDVCRVLEIGNPRDAIGRLDDDERDCVGITDAIGRERQTNLISESGLYALVLTSRKEEAKRFRKWITAEVLPAIRRTGRYEHTLPEPGPQPGGEVAGLPIREAELWLQMVREARLTRGTAAAVRLWDRSPLPALGAAPQASADPQEGFAALAHLAEALAEQIAGARAGAEFAQAALARHLVRVRPDGLFVANRPLPIFAETRWAGGQHRAALLALPGVSPIRNPLTLAGVPCRGVVVPFPLIDGEDAEC